jgi:hypothetical protein
MAPRLRQFALPTLLALSGVAFLIGCIPIPVYRTPDGKPRPESYVGKPGSSKPVQVGRSTLSDVVRVLGQPTEEQRGNTIDYWYSINTIIWFPCFIENENRVLRLSFDDRGILRSYKVYNAERGLPPRPEE